MLVLAWLFVFITAGEVVFFMFWTKFRRKRVEAALAEENAAAVLGLVERLLRPAGKTLVVVTHSPEWLALADRVFEIHEGRLTERERTSPA